MQNYDVIMRIEKETGLPIVFFSETLDRYNNIDCYVHIGQHSAASYDYYLNGTKPINKYNPLTEKQIAHCEALKRELSGIYESSDDPVKLVWKNRISSK